MTVDDLKTLGYAEDVEARHQFLLRRVLYIVSFIFLALPTVVLINRWIAKWLAIIALILFGMAFAFGFSRPLRSRHTGKQMRVEHYDGEDGPGRLYICDETRTYFIVLEGSH